MNDKYLIEKSNVLNNFKCKPRENMTLNELRFFCMYVSKLNPCDPKKREVEIELKDFEEMFKIKLNTTEFKRTIERILTRVMYIYDEQNQKHRLINLYSMFEWTDTSSDSVKISANYDIIPYLWDLQSNYTTYKIGNIAKLNSVSKIRFYEILTQYKKIGFVQFNVEELKDLVQSKQKDFYEFNRNTLTPALKDINEHTDITVTYEKVLKCRKCVALKFFIESKSEKEKVLEAEKQEVKEISMVETPKTLEDLYKKYFNAEQEEHFKENIKTVLQDIYKSEKMIKERAKVIYKQCITNFKINSKTTNIKSPSSYMQGIINNIIKEEIKNPKKEKRQSYDINQFEKFAINYPELQKIENEEVSESHSESVLEPEETKVIHQEKIETAVPEPLSTVSNEIQKIFDETPEGIALFSKVLEIISTTTEYNATISILNIVDGNWKKFEGVCKQIIVSKLKEKENAPKSIHVFDKC